MTVVLSIDQGTSGTKAIVIDKDDCVIGVAEQSITPHYGVDGVVEQDPWQMLNSVLDTAKEAIAQAKVSIDIITLANQGETVLAWEPSSGLPLTPMVVWQDRRSDTICQRLAEYAPMVAQKTGLVLDPYFSAPKMAWIRENLTTKGVVTTSDTWLLHQLTGEFVTDISTASRSLIMNIQSGEWDPELLQLFGLQEEHLPEIVANDVIIGHTTLFGGQIPVGGLIVDQQAALLAQSCTNTGDVKCTFGTGAFILANVGEQPRLSSAGLALSVAWQQRGIRNYCFDGQVYTAASAVRWMIELNLINSAAEMDLVAAADNDGVMCVPALAGLAAPWWKPTAKATLTGMTLATTKSQVVLSVLQGIAAQIAEMMSHVEYDLKRKVTRMRVDGGLTRCRVLMQAVADLTQIEIDVYPSQHATPLGAAALARLALDPTLTLEQAIVKWMPEHTFKPLWPVEKAYSFIDLWNKEVQRTLG